MHESAAEPIGVKNRPTRKSLTTIVPVAEREKEWN